MSASTGNEDYLNSLTMRSEYQSMNYRIQATDLNRSATNQVIPIAGNEPSTNNMLTVSGLQEQPQSSAPQLNLSQVDRVSSSVNKLPSASALRRTFLGVT